MDDRKAFALGALAGAGVALLFDSGGRRRRALIRDQATHAKHEVQEAGQAVRAQARRVGNRANGMAHELRARLRREDASDSVVEERVRSAIGRETAHPGAIAVHADRGEVTLSGDVLAEDARQVRQAASRTLGVRGLHDELSVHEDAGSVSALQDGRQAEERDAMR